MALATRCPHCHTTFRVAHDQLKLRAGLVRCGACKEIFNGIEHLLPQDNLAATDNVAATSAAVPQAPLTAPQSPTVPAPTASSAAPVAHQAPPTAPAPATPLVQQAMSAEPPMEVAVRQTATNVNAGAPDVPHTKTSDPVAKRDDHATAPTQSAASPPMAVEAKKQDDDLDIPDFSEFLKLAEDAPKDEPQKSAGVQSDNMSPALGQTSAYTAPPGLDPDDPLTRMTLMDFHDRQVIPPASAPVKPSPTEEVDPLEQTIDELQSLPDRRKPLPRRKRSSQKQTEAEPPVDAIDAAEEEAEDAEEISNAEEVEEPSFVKKARFEERFGPVINWTLGIGSVLLMLALVAQGIYTFRNQLAARLPKAKPALIKACTWLDCRISLPMQIDAISIEANELQTVGTGKDMFVLSTILRNRSSVTQAWPNLELTLKDTNGKPLVRRVFLPREYLLDTQDVERGFAPSTEQQIKLTFSISQPDSSGYEVAIFYP